MDKIALSALDLAPIKKGENTASALGRTVKIAQHIEKLDFKRIWVAEHHNMEYIASSATSLLIQHIAANTDHIRVGSGGIMLPNHAPLVIAEQFGTLETLFPGRIDLGLGRAPGTDQLTAMALRRNNLNTAFQFPQEVKDLQRYFSADNFDAKVRAFPGEGLDIPLYILGSSTDSAYLAASLGLPYAFATHFAPAQFAAASMIYHQNFVPSEVLEKPYFISCVNVIAADSTEEANFLATSFYNLFAGIVTNTRRPLSEPTQEVIYKGIAAIEQAVQSMASCAFIGDGDKIRPEIEKFVKDHKVDEIMATSYIFDDEKCLRSFSLLKELFG
ncbi:MAG: LLM class flavin-dependent oxidoreductase [Sphingobacterium sp.]|jgi:luciferase family oxidoreductase group 1|uniref:LLM class flavin-dependent oxidoreductase n=1 Tax=Sphingobacterium sp. TaxID=341027 RepID=UPI002826C7E8|nr:LLM class flavin-dependent oxidoreductase [Sphingobacterium sp.]MDR0264730.1 LLM class flavin-dependent oxidoreductase [Sphingobacterium sp.]